MKSHEVKNYVYAAGFPLQEINEGAFYKSRTGDFLVGGSNGYVRFNPALLKDNAFVPPVIFTNLSVSNKPVTLNDETKVLTQSVHTTQHITLDYFESILTFEFAALNFLRPYENQYAYKLEGFDDEWQWVGNRRSATYTNLNDGEYVFLVKGSNNDKVWNTKPIEMKVTVLPPPWKTWWAYMGYAVVIVGGFLLIRYNALKSAQLKHDLKLEQLEKEKWKDIHQLKLQYFTDVSHEFRTPLTLIASPLEELLQSDEGTPWLRKQLKIMYVNCKRLLLLIEQVLEMRQVESGHITLNQTPARIEKLLSEIVDSFKGMADKRNIKLDFDAQPVREAFMVDVDKVEKIFYNLLSNAFKFTPEGGTIAVRMRALEKKDKTWFVVKVSDTGKGIAEDDHERIFKRFYKMGKDSQSNGIGLSLTKSLVEFMGGEITVDSKLNFGSSFTVKLPFVAAVPGVPALTENERPFIKSVPLQYQALLVREEMEQSMEEEEHRELILIVEDNRDLRDYLKDHLRKNFRVITAKNGEKGLMKAKKYGPHVVISDIMMAKMDGLELCRRVKEDQELSHTPVILLTAKGTDV